MDFQNVENNYILHKSMVLLYACTFMVDSRILAHSRGFVKVSTVFRWEGTYFEVMIAFAITLQSQCNFVSI